MDTYVYFKTLAKDRLIIQFFKVIKITKWIKTSVFGKIWVNEACLTMNKKKINDNL